MRINKDTPVIYLSTSRFWNPFWKMYKGRSELGSLQCIIIWSCQEALYQWLGDLVVFWHSYNSFRGFMSSSPKHMQNRAWLMCNTLYNNQKTAALFSLIYALFVSSPLHNKFCSTPSSSETITCVASSFSSNYQLRQLELSCCGIPDSTLGVIRLLSASSLYHYGHNSCFIRQVSCPHYNLLLLCVWVPNKNSFPNFAGIVAKRNKTKVESRVEFPEALYFPLFGVAKQISRFCGDCINNKEDEAVVSNFR